MITTLIADDHHVVRQGLKILLEEAEGITVIGEAENGEIAIDLVKEEAPDVILLDLRMPVKDGLSTIKELNQMGCKSHILVLTGFSDDDDAVQALRFGAKGYLKKEEARPAEIITAIHRITQNEIVIPDGFEQQVVKIIQGNKTKENEKNTDLPHAQLTERELTVLKLVAQGLSNLEIATQLEITDRTAGTHVGNILGKLGTDNRTQATLYALRHGIAKL